MRKVLLIGMLLLSMTCSAQEEKVDMDSPTFVPTVKVGKVFEGGDSIQYMEMNNVYVFPPVTFSSKKQANAYMRLVKNVKTVLPIAKEANMIMMETAEYLETLPDKRAKEAHMKRVEQSIMKEYKPRMKKLTYSQGKLLIKLIYRESNSSSFSIFSASIVSARMLPMMKAPNADEKPTLVDMTAIAQHSPSDTMSSTSLLMSLRTERRKRGMAKIPTTSQSTRKKPILTTDPSICPPSGLLPLAMALSITIMTMARISSSISTLITSPANCCWRSPKSSKAL